VEGKTCTSSSLARQRIKGTFEAARQIHGGQDTISVAAEEGIIQGVPKKVTSTEIYPIVVKQDVMRLEIKNSIQLCLRTLVFSIVLRHSNYNNRIISIDGTFLGDTL
jgi:hypothetical protein